ncbi:DUF4330 family protein [Halobacteriaceae archaeon GCM10025711]
MEVIDEQGRLFGVVNVIDALVVLLVLAVAVAGIALLTQSGGDDSAGSGGADGTATTTRYATLDLGNQPTYVVERIREGDEVTPGATTITVTDVYVGPGKGSSARTLVRVEIEGEAPSDQQPLTVGDTPVTVGSGLQLDATNYTVKGTIVDLDAGNPALETNETQVLLETTTSATRASQLHEGDTQRISDRAVARVESVTAYPTANAGQRRLLVGVTVQTFDRSGMTLFGNQRAAVGTGLTLDFGTHVFSGTVTRLGATTPPGDAATTTAVVELDNVSPGVADSLAAGMTESARGDTHARITAVHAEPAQVTVRSDDGTLHLRDHPQNEDVTITVELSTRRTDDGLQFHGDRLQENDRIVLDFDTVTVRGTATDLG